jgi:hypothetical protein
MELSTAIRNQVKPQYKILDELVIYHDQIDTMLVDDPNVVVDELIIAENIMVNSGKLLADAKYWLNEAMHSDTINTMKMLTKEQPKITSTAINQIVKSLCKDQQYLVDFADRINRSATHRADYCRSIMSKHKAEMFNRY